MQTLAAMMLVSVTAQGAEHPGLPRVVDGDTLVIGTTKIRLEGIDAPETDQICLDARGVRWTCGIDARDSLVAHIAGRDITCTSSGIDAYNRMLSTCRVMGEDLNGWMVQEIGRSPCEVLFYVCSLRGGCSNEQAWPLAGGIYCALGLASP